MKYDNIIFVLRTTSIINIPLNFLLRHIKLTTKVNTKLRWSDSHYNQPFMSSYITVLVTHNLEESAFRHNLLWSPCFTKNYWNIQYTARPTIKLSVHTSVSCGKKCTVFYKRLLVFQQLWILPGNYFRYPLPMKALSSLKLE